MGAQHVSFSRSVGFVASFRRLVEWWTQASQEERYTLYRAAIHGDKEAPPLKILRQAINVAEIAHGEVEYGQTKVRV